MDFGLSDEHSALQDAARQFVERHCPPRQAKEWDETNTHPHQLLKAIAPISGGSRPRRARAMAIIDSPVTFF